MSGQKPKPVQYPETLRGVNFFDVDRNLDVFLRRHAPDLLKKRRDSLRNIGDFVGDRLDRQAEQTDQDFQPSLRDVPNSRSKPTGRRNEIRLNAEYEACQQELYREGLLADCFKGKNRSHILPFVGQYLVSQSDIATGCPFAMTHPVAYVLDQIAPKALRDKYLKEITRKDGKTAICGTWATERHSGSDVGGSITKASPAEKSGEVRLQGHNWFTSAFGFKKFLAIKTARPDGAPQGSKGLGLYLVPSHIDKDWSVGNNFNITHLKRKLGTRGLPTVEVDLEGATAYEIAPAGQGVKAMMAALGCSRVHNAMGAAGVMHRSYMEALSWASHRETFGEKLITRPMIQKRILDIGTEWMAGSALAFEAAKSFDDAVKDPAKAGWMRIATALAKFKTAEQAVWCAQKAVELVGGNGYTEDYPTARQFRDAMVLTVWEGPEQIQALELMRMVAGSAPGDQVFLNRIDEIIKILPDTDMAGEKRRLSEMRTSMAESLEQLRRAPKSMELVADEFLHKMSDMLSYALLCDEAAWELQHDNNRQKLLVARHFHEKVFKANPLKPDFESGALHRHFNEMVTGMPVKKPAHPKPGALKKPK